MPRAPHPLSLQLTRAGFKTRIQLAAVSLVRRVAEHRLYLDLHL